MTVSELCSFYTDDLASHSRFFPTDINVPHHQLRNFISSTYKNRLYYVHNYDIFVFDLDKHQRSLVATVPFEARCLAAAHGWVCVGGEVKGDCAFIRIGEEDSQGGTFGLDLVVDTLGKEIVNSMTIHRMSAEDPGYQDEIVVLISNNDKTVTLYSLSRQEVLSVLPHPKPMNYASMSPDCKLIAAVGDANEAYFYERHGIGKSGRLDTGLAHYKVYDWVPLATPPIPAGQAILGDWSFAVAFAPDGSMCAVSAQGGLITVFDIRLLLKDNQNATKAIICSFKSSRPSLWGCVRSMAFSPAPWDLLAWTEDHGRIGIADVRRDFTRRQHVYLDETKSKRIVWEDATPREFDDLDVKERLKNQHLQRMRVLRGQIPLGARSFEGSQRQQPDPDTTQYHRLDLNESERSVLDALESTMSEMAGQATGPYSVNYTSNPTVQPSASVNAQTGEYEVQLLNPRFGARYVRTMPRRRQSIISPSTTTNAHLQPLDSSRTIMTASPASMSEDSTVLTPPSTGSSVQTLPSSIPPSDPWYVIEATMAANRARNPTFGAASDAPTTMLYVESAIRSERQLSDRLERQLADERRLSALVRGELETRESLTDTLRQESQARRSADSRTSPPVELIIYRQLQMEQDNGRQRSNEIESEIRSNSQRMERLTHEREQLLSRTRLPHQDTNFTSGRSTALPTTNTGSQNLRELEVTVRRIEQERLARQHRIADLEAQVRRAESRVELASMDSRSDRAEHATRRTPHERLLDARFLSAARSGTATGSLRQLRSTTADNVASDSSHQAATNRIRSAATRRAELAMNADRSSIPRSSELHGRATDLDMRMARVMMQRAGTDANGNWIAGYGLRHLLGARRAPGAGGVPSQGLTYEAMMEDAGVGTAGIGWSPDGKFLYAGSETGIFEFKVNLRDRMYFPALEMR